jgi:hypothetical protein
MRKFTVIFSFFIIFVASIITLESIDSSIRSLASVQTQMNDMNFSAQDVAVGPQGTMMVIGSDGRAYTYNSREAYFELIGGDSELPKLNRIVIDDDGTPYVVSECGGQAFYLDCSNKWVALPGCVRDIGAGKHGEIWAIGCDERVGGYGVWRLFCDSDCNYGLGIRYCSRQKDSYIIKTKKNCHWYRIEGAGIRIDVDTRGNPWVVAENNMVYNYDGINWKSLPGFKASDVSVSTEGVVFAAGFDKKTTGRLVNADIGTWQILAAASQHIAVGPFSHFFTVCHEGKVHSSVCKDLY